MDWLQLGDGLHEQLMVFGCCCKRKSRLIDLSSTVLRILSVVGSVKLAVFDRLLEQLVVILAISN